ncbi:MAG TPA: S1C family serine protease, partial [Allocoleopsis sp.]
MGTGFFVSSDMVLTNFHVIDGMTHVKIRFSTGQECSADSAAAYDLEDDLIMLQSRCKNGVTVHLGDSAVVQPGQSVVVISNAEGLEQSISNGLISGIREIEGKQRFQISAPISSGSSGGPVFDMNGRVIAVVVGFLAEGQNLNFAIPIRYAMPLLAAKTRYSLASLPSKKKPLSSNEDEYARAVAEQVLKDYAADETQRQQSEATALLKQIATQIAGCEPTFTLQKVSTGWVRSQIGPATKIRFDLEPVSAGFSGTVEFSIPRLSTPVYKKR